VVVEQHRAIGREHAAIRRQADALPAAMFTRSQRSRSTRCRARVDR
jgi:hypothetical protein